VPEVLINDSTFIARHWPLVIKLLISEDHEYIDFSTKQSGVVTV